jgi:hypothetical protein
MTRDDLTALIARVEAARGPDRELDAEIAWMRTARDKKRLGPPDLGREVWHAGLPTPAWVKWDSVAAFHPRPTGSLEAAVAMVPKGFGYLVGVNDDTPVACVFLGHLFDDDRHWVAASNPALALTAAALRARLAMMGDDA